MATCKDCVNFFELTPLVQFDEQGVPTYPPAVEGECRIKAPVTAFPVVPIGSWCGEMIVRKG